MKESELLSTISKQKKQKKELKSKINDIESKYNDKIFSLKYENNKLQNTIIILKKENEELKGELLNGFLTANLINELEYLREKIKVQNQVIEKQKEYNINIEGKYNILKNHHEWLDKSTKKDINKLKNKLSKRLDYTNEIKLNLKKSNKDKLDLENYIIKLERDAGYL
jgi:hypothetical protein